MSRLLVETSIIRAITNSMETEGTGVVGESIREVIEIAIYGASEIPER